MGKGSAGGEVGWRVVGIVIGGILEDVSVKDTSRHREFSDFVNIMPPSRIFCRRIFGTAPLACMGNVHLQDRLGYVEWLR